MFFQCAKYPGSLPWHRVLLLFLFSGKYPRTGRRWYAYRHRYAYHSLSSTALRESNLNRKGEVMFGEVVGRVSGIGGGSAREGVALLLGRWLSRYVVEWKEVSSRLMWVRMKIERENLVFISAYPPGSEEGMEKFCNELNERVGSFF